MARSRSFPKKREKHCYFLTNQIKTLDYKDIKTLQRFVNHYGGIAPRRRTGLSPKWQRRVAKAIKRARIMGLLPFVKR